jgi:anti-sigma regulatory factor (Ser/Thr protein kinase)
MSDDRAEVRRGEFSFAVANTRSSAHFLRVRFARFVAECALGTECAGDIILAVGEALANAAEHGHRRNGTIWIRARETSQRDLGAVLEVEVVDDGHGFAAHPQAVGKKDLQPRGFGIHIMRSVMDAVEFYDGGRRVVLKKRLQRP